MPTLLPPDERRDEASLDDLDVIVELGRKFHEQMVYAGDPFDAEHFRATCQGYIEHPDFVLLIGDKAMCAGMIGRHPASGQPMASEIFLYSEGARQGLKLLKALKAWAAERGAKTLLLTDQMNLRSLAPLYARLGAQEVERVYRMEV